MEGKLGDKVIWTGPGGKEFLGFVTEEGDHATVHVFNENGVEAKKGAFRSKADGERDGAGNTYRPLGDK